MRKELKKAFEWMAKGERYLRLENVQEIAKEIEATALCQPCSCTTLLAGTQSDISYAYARMTTQRKI